MSTGRQLTPFDCLSSGTKRSKIQTSYSTDGNTCLDSTDSYDLEELIDSGTESEGDGDDHGFGGPGNHQDITINKPRGPTTIVLNAASNVPRAQSDKPRQLGEVQHQHPPSHIASGLFEVPIQPRIKFPLRFFGAGRQRAFNPEW